MTNKKTTNTNHLPHSTADVVLTDGGLETVLIFDDGFELPLFASFPLLDTEDGRAALRKYFRGFASLGRDHGVPVQLETPTWRASADWGAQLGYDEAELARVNTAAIELLQQIRDEYQTQATPIAVSGNIGPRGDGYLADDLMTADDAEAYHRTQVGTFAGTGADMVTALTMTYAEEAIGIARAAAVIGIPSVISFTVETDGRLPSGQALGEAIEQVDATTGNSPLFFGINCAHPDHFGETLDAGGEWVQRVQLIRANASRMSHEELDNAEELDAGDPVELGAIYAELVDRFPNLTVLGGCCGTADVHIDHIGRSVAAGPTSTI